jgi:N-acetylglucosamine-6-phosphate deacetylase
MRIHARNYATGDPTEIVCEQAAIATIAPPSGSLPDLEAGWVAPAFFDLQINGCMGHSFNSERLTADEVREVVAVCRRHGIGGFCPTLVTNSLSALTQALQTICQTCDSDSDVAEAVQVIHLEGPYLSPEDGPRGAHPRQHIRQPDWDEFCHLQEAAGGRIRLVTLAPEHEGALRFIERLTATGVVVALGHTAASAARIRDAVVAGARLSTHLGNGCHAILARHENYIWEQLAEDRLWASIICDGHHLPPAVVRCLVRVKTPARTILTCDASSLAGMPVGQYSEWDQALQVTADGRVLLPGTSYLAGSGTFTDVCVRNVMRDAGVSLSEAVDMASARPRALLGLAPRLLQVGHRADLVCFDWGEDGNLRVRALISGGRIKESITSRCKSG